MFRPDLQGSKLTTEEKKLLHGLLEEFSKLFDDGELGRTSKIRHAVTTFRPPLRQPIHRLPMALKKKKTVQEEVQKNDAEEQGYSSKYQSLVFTYHNGSEERWQLAVLYRFQKT